MKNNKVTLEVTRSRKGNTFLVLDNGRYHYAGPTIWLTVDDVRALLDNTQIVQAFLDAADGPAPAAQAPARYTPGNGNGNGGIGTTEGVDVSVVTPLKPVTPLAPPVVKGKVKSKAELEREAKQAAILNSVMGKPKMAGRSPMAKKLTDLKGRRYNPNH